MDNFNNGYYQQPTWYYNSQQPTTVVPQYYNYNPYARQTATVPNNYLQNNGVGNVNNGVNNINNATSTGINNGLNGGLIWVQGLAAAQAYSNLVPGVPVALWDSEEETVYIKSVDQNGKPSMTILDYHQRNSGNSSSNNDNVADNQQIVKYATKEQIDDLTDQFNKLNSLSYVTKEQFDGLGNNMKELNNQLNDLSCQIDDIENRITSFGKPQQQQNNNRKVNK